MRGTVHREGEPTPLAVDIVVEADLVRASSAEGGTFSIRLAEASVTAGGYEGKHVFLRTPDGTLTIATDDEAMVPALEGVADERLKTLLREVGLHRERHSRATLFGIAFAVVVVLLAALGVGGGLYFAPRWLASSVDALPVSVDRQIGDAAAAQVEEAGPALEDPTLSTFVEEIVSRLEPHASTPGFDFRVRVVESDQMNAFALPGGQIVVFTGLLRSADRPEEVAGVLAHEMAHVTLRHGIRNVAHRAGLLVAVSILLGDASGWVELAADAAILAQSNDYSREQEAAADAEGVRMLMAAGVDPMGLAEFFSTLADEPGTELEGAMTWWSTHPDHASRVAHVRELAGTLPAAPRRPLDVDWRAVQRAVGD